ncbi:uncharacterized protein LOC120329293 [Styela clava]|uniref:late secretory pathway protein AVL9-like n=1 Tax=Styela clava TaxID=7725 RepID=UPI00193A39FF|nr:late secretory pathway protein AVL9-like [Styela clava]
MDDLSKVPPPQCDIYISQGIGKFQSIKCDVIQMDNVHSHLLVSSNKFGKFIQCDLTENQAYQNRSNNHNFKNESTSNRVNMYKKYRNELNIILQRKAQNSSLKRSAISVNPLQYEGHSADLSPVLLTSNGKCSRKDYEIQLKPTITCQPLSISHATSNNCPPKHRHNNSFTSAKMRYNPSYRKSPVERKQSFDHESDGGTKYYILCPTCFGDQDKENSDFTSDEDDEEGSDTDDEQDDIASGEFEFTRDCDEISLENDSTGSDDSDENSGNNGGESENSSLYEHEIMIQELDTLDMGCMEDEDDFSFDQHGSINFRVNDCGTDSDEYIADTDEDPYSYHRGDDLDIVYRCNPMDDF